MVARETCFLIAVERKLRLQGKGQTCSVSSLTAELELGCGQLSFKGVFYSVPAGPGLTHSFSTHPHPGALPRRIWEGIKLKRSLFLGLNLVLLHLENKVIKMVQFEFVCGLGICFFYCHLCLWLVCKNQASDSLITPRLLACDSPTPTPGTLLFLLLFLRIFCLPVKDPILLFFFPSLLNLPITTHLTEPISIS